MALIGKKRPDDKKTAKKPARGSASKKRGVGSKNAGVASVDDVNQATSSIEEESTPQVRSRKTASSVESLSKDKNSAYGGFSPQTHSELAAETRKNEQGSDQKDQYEVDYEVGVIYADENGREYYIDEYGVHHFADEITPSPDIPESFEDARNSESRERFRREAEHARQNQAESRASNFDSVVSGTSNEFSGQNGNASGFNGGSHNGHSGDGNGYPQEEASYSPNGYGNAGGSGGYGSGSGSGQGSNRTIHPEGTPTVNIADAPHIPNPYLEGSTVINDQIDQGTVAENFPSIATTIASLVNSSKTPEEITRTLLGYLQTTLAGEGADATIKLLGTDNIYAPLLVSALTYNLQQARVEPIALRELWNIAPEVKIQEKIVYVRDNSAPRDGEQGHWISLENVTAPLVANPLFDELTKKADDERIPEDQIVHFDRFDY